jgi:hypothetical protein
MRRLNSWENRVLQNGFCRVGPIKKNIDEFGHNPPKHKS